jgi:glutamate-1-semialdehyde 2,1-aminomutase
VGGVPRFIDHGEGSRIFDVDGNSYIDYVGSWGPLLLGHRPPAVIDALREVLESGTSFGAPTAREVELAELIAEMVPSMEMVRLVNSGTEATMSALRLARGFTGRDLTIKFEGCYHGHVDSLLVKAGSGVATLGIADTQGVPKAFCDTTIAVPFNSPEAVEQAFRAYGDRIAAVIVEPVVGNMGCVPPLPGYLEGLREITYRYGSLFIFDEVMTGFRVAFGGAQQRFGIRPDLTTLGKVIGGGMPVGAFGGKRAIMEKIAPLGPVYQAGTLSGNPVAVAAGLATLKEIQAPGFYDRLAVATKSLTDGLTSAAKRVGVSFAAQSIGGMFGIYFADRVPDTYDTVMAGDKARFNKFFHAMLDAGVYFAPSAFEAGFVSAAHSADDIATTVTLAEKAFINAR